MIQGGDSAEKTGVKGGESIWGPTSFPDEFHPDNLHDKVCYVTLCTTVASSKQVKKERTVNAMSNRAVRELLVESQRKASCARISSQGRLFRIGR